MSNREPLVVKQTREIPTEIMFDTRHATQDSLIKNRYWFDLPEQWQSTIDKDPILGIRDIFVARGCRLITFDFTMTLTDLPSEGGTNTFDIPFSISVYLDSDKDIGYLVSQYYEQVTEQLSDWIENEQLDYKINEYLISCIPSLKYHHDNDVNKCLLEFTLKTENLTYDGSIYYTNILTIEFGEDSNMILDIDNTITTEEYITVPIFWDRYPMYIKSSLASITTDNYLGHTDRMYTPIKYYRLSSRENKFWIELYSSRSHTTLSILGSDGKDDLMIEGIVLLDASGMI